eukprot:Nk52_evm37s156 gene=Nk52_evmTU37s156
MADFYELITTHSSSAKLIGLQNVLKGSEELSMGRESLVALIGRLDAQSHSLGYCHCLLRWVLCLTPQVSVEEQERFITTCSRFLRCFNKEHILIAHPQFVQLCQHYTDLLITLGQAIRGLLPLKTALESFRPNEHVLTPVHVNFTQACLAAKHFSYAKPIIDQAMYDIAPETTSLMPVHVLLYYYYTGMLFLGVRKYRQALYSFVTVLNVPATVVSAISAEAEKKAHLVSLLIKSDSGCFNNDIVFPRANSKNVEGGLSKLNNTYHEFVKCFSRHSVAEVVKFVEVNREEFVRDGNYGIVKQCMVALYHRKIQRLTRSFMTLSFGDIAKAAELSSPDVAESFVVQMIENRQLYAKINQQDRMILFLDTWEQGESGMNLNCLKERTFDIINLFDRVKYIEEQILITPSYVQMTHERTKSKFIEDDEGTDAMQGSTKFRS